FNLAANQYLSELTYHRGSLISVADLFNSFIELVQNYSPAHAQCFARDFRKPFQWCLSAHVHQLEREYDKQPWAIEFMEKAESPDGRLIVAVRRDGQRHIWPSFWRPEHPMMLFEGQFLPSITKAIRSIVPSSEFLTETKIINVAPPESESE